jgi:2-keto-4-pentenoate hydratase/2-oxohepta-3-ene-1,7-dioic acid hydratase in catechol pathway
LVAFGSQNRYKYPVNIGKFLIPQDGIEMKLVRIMHNNQPRWGLIHQSEIQLLEPPQTDWTSSWNASGSGAGIPQWILELIESGAPDSRLSGTLVPLAGADWLAPVTPPEKIICIGTNYAEHAREMGGTPPALPVVFSKFPSALLPPGGVVLLPPISEKVDFEAELVVVIGRTGKNISREQAMKYVLGYCCGNDISARDWQKEKPGGQWLLGKTFDSFAPLGPMLVTADEIANPHNLKIQLRLNGGIMQDSSTDQLIFPIDHLIAHLSQFFTLSPGDLIFTGTPSGVGAGRTPPVFLKPGDQLEVEIENLGILKNRVTAAVDS